MTDFSISHSYRSEDRTISYVDEPPDQYVDIELDCKEDVDVINALEALNLDANNLRLDASLPIEEMLLLAHGGTQYPNSARLMVPSDDHAKTIVHALCRHDPDPPDLTDRVLTTILAALTKAPLEYDIESLEDIIASYD